MRMSPLSENFNVGQATHYHLVHMLATRSFQTLKSVIFMTHEERLVCQNQVAWVAWILKYVVPFVAHTFPLFIEPL